MVYLTGDTHGSVDRIKRFCNRMNLGTEDVIVILGDVGLNFFLNQKDFWPKFKLSTLKPTIFCVHGNHEERPYNIHGYKEVERFGGTVYVQDAFPNIVFAKDGEIYKLPSQDGTIHSVMVIGGAYSVDKEYRLLVGSPWFESEQPNDEIKSRVYESLKRNNFEVDNIFSHTLPEQFIPTEQFINGLDQSKVDRSTEAWLQEIYDKVNLRDRWFCGHWHCDKSDGKLRLLYTSYDIL